MQLCRLLTIRWCQCLQGFSEQCIDLTVLSLAIEKQTNETICIDSLICSKWKAPKEIAGVGPFPATRPFNCFGFGSQIHLLSSFASTSSGGVTTKTTTSTAFKFVLMLKNQRCRVRWKLELDAISTAGFVLQGALSWAVMHNEGSDSEPVSACRLDKGKARKNVTTRIFIVLPKGVLFFLYQVGSWCFIVRKCNFDSQCS